MNYSSNTSDSQAQRVGEVLPITVNGVLLASNLWIIVSLIHYGQKHRKWSGISSTNSEKLSHGLIYVATVVCFVISQLRFILTFVELSVHRIPNADNQLCEILGDFSYCVNNFAFFVAELVFWLRQRVFYSNKMLSGNYNRYLLFVSRYSILYIIIFGFSSLILHTVLYPAYFYEHEGCAHKVDSTLHVVSIAMICFTYATGELILITLFIYPMRKRLRQSSLARAFTGKRSDIPTISSTSNPTLSTDVQRNSRDNVVADDANTPKRSRATSSLRDEIRGIMTRSIVLLCVSVVSGVALTIITYQIAKRVDLRNEAIVVSDLFLFAHDFYIICSFSAFKAMLTSPLGIYK